MHLSDGALVGPVLGVQAQVLHEEEVLAKSLSTQAALGGLHLLSEALVRDQPGVLADASTGASIRCVLWLKALLHRARLDGFSPFCVLVAQ